MRDRVLLQRESELLVDVFIPIMTLYEILCFSILKMEFSTKSKESCVFIIQLFPGIVCQNFNIHFRIEFFIFHTLDESEF